ncbi:acylphosphatase [Pseudemcibacter aquimaris]|uniref:acylphosphatase n=1 Tax=Pseudemcibacter aquimaris TaxID=2857064 RepID=UPI002011DD88|nr:acylphosphatase [Pseudemcibacter aquimaris]MCC3860461.1 acylphosphatase [Pseudemcibacter aquimaris]WDU59286.1 acylphosphatase [Pseudemcibacter aquimaris]
MLDEGQKAARLVIYGRVQGVFFRDWTVDTASRLGLDGWVRNRSDGTVEAMLVGQEELVEKMIKECRTGPRMSKVENIDISPARGIVKKGFERKPTVNIHERRGL